MKIINSILAFASVLMVACSGGATTETEPFNYFKPEVKYVADKPIKKLKVKCRVPNTENYNIGNPYIFDSMFIFTAIYDPDYYFAAINIESGEEIGKFVHRGRGPREFTRMYGGHDFVKQNGDVKLYVCGSDSVFMCNVSQSLKSGITTYECSMLKPYHNYKEKDKKTGEMIDRQHFVNPILYLDTDRVFCMIDSYGRRGEVPDEYKSMFDGIAANQTLQIMPQYFIYSLREHRRIKEYDQIFSVPAFLRPFYGYGKHNATLDMLSEKVAISTNTSRTKVAMAAFYLPQLNILDLESGQMSAIRVEGTPLAVNEQFVAYAGDIVSDDNYIYVLHYGPEYTKFSRSTGNSSPTDYYQLSDEEWKKQGGPNAQLHVYDWSGKLVGRYELDGAVTNVLVSNGRLFSHRKYSGTVLEYEWNLK